MYPFLLDAVGVFDRLTPHLRAASARRAIHEPDAPVRDQMTVSYLVFPATIMVVHPDFFSCMSMIPQGPRAFRWIHDMLVPAARADETDHWQRSFELIEDGVFAKEDIAVAVKMQTGLDSGANDALTFGRLEQAAAWFHHDLIAMLDVA